MKLCILEDKSLTNDFLMEKKSFEQMGSDVPPDLNICRQDARYLNILFFLAALCHLMEFNILLTFVALVWSTHHYFS